MSHQARNWNRGADAIFPTVGLRSCMLSVPARSWVAWSSGLYWTFDRGAEGRPVTACLLHWDADRLLRSPPIRVCARGIPR
jgi:hypothetical protein